VVPERLYHSTLCLKKNDTVYFHHIIWSQPVVHLLNVGDVFREPYRRFTMPVLLAVFVITVYLKCNLGVTLAGVVPMLNVACFIVVAFVAYALAKSHPMNTFV